MGKQDHGLDKYQPIDITKLVKAPWNYKEEDDFMSKQLVGNLKQNGQVENILVRELDDGQFEVVNGNHRYDAMKELGFEVVMTYNLGKISLAAAKRIAVATNETKFKSDPYKFAQLMNELQTEFSIESLQEDMPFSANEIENFKQLSEFNWEGTNRENNSDSSNETEAGSFSGDEDFRRITFNLPEGVADQLEAQIDRLKAALHPEESDNLSAISPVMAIEAICQHIAQIPDEELV